MRQQIKTLGTVFCVALVLGLAGCGRKPSFNDLEAPEPKRESAEATAPAGSPAIDGEDNETANVATNKPKQKFFLDFLL